MPTFVGSLRIGVLPVGYLAHRASARSARLTILAHQLVFDPFGLVRGIGGDVILMKHDLVNIHPITAHLFLGNEDATGIAFEKPGPNSRVNEGLHFRPRNAPVADVLTALEAQGYDIDPKIRIPRFWG